MASIHLCGAVFHDEDLRRQPQITVPSAIYCQAFCRHDRTVEAVSLVDYVDSPVISLRWKVTVDHLSFFCDLVLSLTSVTANLVVRLPTSTSSFLLLTKNNRETNCLHQWTKVLVDVRFNAADFCHKVD